MTNGEPVQKKGLSPIAWVAIGCVGLIVLAGIAFTVGTALLVKKGKDFVAEAEANPAQTLGKTYARFNPDLDYIDADEGDGTITFRNTETNEEFVVDVKDVKQGRVKFTGPEGTVTFGANEDGGGIVVDSEEGRTVIGADGQGMTVTGPDGETRARIGTAVNAEEMPDWLELYPGGTVVSSYFGTQNGRQGGHVTLTTADGVDEVVAFYKELLDEGDFRLLNDTRSQQAGTLVAILTGKDDNGNAFNMMATEQNGKTQVVLSHGVE